MSAAGTGGVWVARQAWEAGGWQAVRGGSIILHTRPCRGFTCATRTHTHTHAHARARAHTHTHKNAHAQSDRGEPPACATLPFCVGARVFTVVEIDKHKRPPPPRWRSFSSAPTQHYGWTTNFKLCLHRYKYSVIIIIVYIFVTYHHGVRTPLTTADEHNTFDSNCNDNDDNMVVMTRYSHTSNFALHRVTTRTKHCETG